MFDSDSVSLEMSAVVDKFQEQMKKVRTGRAHPDMLAGVRAEVYGSKPPALRSKKPKLPSARFGMMLARISRTPRNSPKTIVRAPKKKSTK